MSAIDANPDRHTDARPRDLSTFGALASSYNFRHPSDRCGLFVQLLVEECARAAARQGKRGGVRVMDIGCGRGIGLDPKFLEPVRGAADELWGIEPDTRIAPPPGVFDQFQHAFLENAALPEGADGFDVAYSFMVMEHVMDPMGFMRALHRCLKPGGTYLFITINGAHYFARIAGLLRALRLDEAVLRLVRRDVVDEYHYPVAYKFNTPRAIERCAAELGFERPEYVFVEREGPSPYFPGPLRPALHALNYKRNVVRNPRSLLELICRIRKPG